MLSFILALLVFVLTVFIVAGVHELGHFCLARLFKIKVLKFSIGFGKRLWRVFDKRGTEYRLSLIPIGGYVKLLDSREGTVPADELPNAFDQRPIYQRLCVLAAGPVFNFLLAILAFWIIFIHGVVYIKPIVGVVIPNSLAATAGVKPQDQITAIDEHVTPSWSSVAMALLRHYGDEGVLTFTVRSASNQQRTDYAVNISPAKWHLDDLRPDLLTSVGIQPYIPVDLKKDKKGKVIWPANLLEHSHDTVSSALNKAVYNTSYFISFNGIVLYKMLVGKISWRGLSGPVGIFQAAFGAAQHGAIIYLNFLALISISIGLLNLLPIPGLDGAQIVYLLYEFTRGKPMSVAAQLLAFRLGVILLIIVMLQALINDLLRLR